VGKSELNTDNNKKYFTRCILLVVLKNTLKMHGDMNIKVNNTFIISKEKVRCSDTRNHSANKNIISKPFSLLSIKVLQI